MPGIKIVTDGACDLPQKLASERQISVVPLTVRFGHEEYAELSSQEFWDRVAIDPTMPETAAPSAGAFQRAFLDAADEGASGAICVNLSSKLSATYQAAVTAARAVADRIVVRVVDSLSASMGLGLMVMAAADLVQAGRTADDIALELNEIRDRTRLFAVMGSLDFLKRGGRIGGGQALLGSLLSIKPIVQLRDGLVEAESRQRTRRRAIEYLASKALSAGRLDRLAMASGAASDSDELKALLGSANCAHELVVTDLGPVIGSHAGPGTIGVTFQIAR
jgi:DegV family protein with EDD domain